MDIIEENAKTAKQIRKAEGIQKRTRKREVFERYEVLRQVGIYGTAFTFVVSFATGVSFFYYLFLPSMYWQLSIGLSLFVAIAIELLRTGTFDAFFRIAYEEKRFSPPLQITALFGLVFLAISFATSLYGAKWGYESFDQDAQKEKASHTIDLASLRQRFDDKIAKETKAYQTDATIAENKKRVDSEKKALAEFKASITWQGAINISDPQVASNISAFNARISAMEMENIRYAKNRQAQYEQAIKRIEADRDSALATETRDHNEKYVEAKSKTVFNTWVWIIIAVCVEVFALAFAWLPHWYDYYCALYMQSFEPRLSPVQQAYQEAYYALSELLPHFIVRQGKGLSPTTQSLGQDLIQVLNNTTQDKIKEPSQGLPIKNPIGFDVGKGSDKNYEGLYQRIVSGEPINRQALGKYGFGVSIPELNAMFNAVTGTAYRTPPDIQQRIDEFVAKKKPAPPKTAIETEAITQEEFVKLKRVQATLF